MRACKRLLEFERAMDSHCSQHACPKFHIRKPAALKAFYQGFSADEVLA